jgi:dTDP-L-rhamnose 4-epimerase
MKILITGGAGFIGSRLCEILSKGGHDLVIIDNLLPQVHGDNPKETSETFKRAIKHAKLIEGSAEDQSSWQSSYGIYYDAIVCLAAETGTGQSMMKANSYCTSNINSIALLNDLIIQGHIECGKVILASSRAIYGDANLDECDKPIATKETDNKAPASIYAITKLSQEQILFTGFASTPVCALRFQNVYGPGQSLKNPYTGILSIFSTAIKNKKNIQVFDDGMMSRDFVYIEDVVDSIILAINNDDANGEVFNVGSGVATTVLKVADTLKSKYNSNVNINLTGEKIKGDIRHNFADISKIRKLGFEPKVYFEEGIDRFVSWVESQGRLDDNNYEESLSDFRKKGILK